MEIKSAPSVALPNLAEFGGRCRKAMLGVWKCVCVGGIMRYAASLFTACIIYCCSCFPSPKVTSLSPSTEQQRYLRQMIISSSRKVSDWCQLPTYTATSLKQANAMTFYTATSLKWANAMTSYTATSLKWANAMTFYTATSLKWANAMTSYTATSLKWANAMTSYTATSLKWANAMTSYTATSLKWANAMTFYTATSLKWSNAMTFIHCYIPKVG